MSDVSTSELVLRADPEDVPWDLTVDVVVAGSGAAGWAAAVGAALHGASVLVLEKESGTCWLKGEIENSVISHEIKHGGHVL